MFTYLFIFSLNDDESCFTELEYDCTNYSGMLLKWHKYDWAKFMRPRNLQKRFEFRQKGSLLMYSFDKLSNRKANKIKFLWAFDTHPSICCPWSRPWLCENLFEYCSLNEMLKFLTTAKCIGM